jgi:hypothetical protein
MTSSHEKAIIRFQKLVTDSDRICPITQEPIVKPAYTLCGHIFEWDALLTWRNTHPSNSKGHWTCPFCSYSNVIAFMHYNESSAIYFLKRTPIHNLPK